MQTKGVMSIGGVRVRDLMFKVLVRLLVAYHACKFKIILTLLISMLAQNLLDLASVMRET